MTSGTSFARHGNDRSLVMEVHRRSGNVSGCSATRGVSSPTNAKQKRSRTEAELLAAVRSHLGYRIPKRVEIVSQRDASYTLSLIAKRIDVDAI